MLRSQFLKLFGNLFLATISWLVLRLSGSTSWSLLNHQQRSNTIPFLSNNLISSISGLIAAGVNWENSSSLLSSCISSLCFYYFLVLFCTLFFAFLLSFFCHILVEIVQQVITWLKHVGVKISCSTIWIILNLHSM